MSAPRRALCALAVAAALFALPAGASAWPGDWTIAGDFARTTAPSFQGGFNPSDVATATAAFDNRAKALTLRLAFFEPPARGGIDVDLGRGRPDGSCDASALGIAIEARDRWTETTREVAVPRWIPPTTDIRWTWSRTYGPLGYTLLGYDAWRMQYQWIRVTPGRWTQDVQQVVESAPDPDAHDRVATLVVDGIDGALEASAVVTSSQTELQWTFASPLLDGVRADCLEVRIPGRAAPFTIAPAPAPAPFPIPAPEPSAGDAPADDTLDLDAITATATRSGGRVVLQLTGSAERVGIRVRALARETDFRSRIAIRNVPASARSVQLRFSDGEEWSDWRRIPVR